MWSEPSNPDHTGYNAIKTIKKGAVRWTQESVCLRGGATAEPLVDVSDVQGDMDEQHLAVQCAGPHLSQAEECSAMRLILTSKSFPIPSKGFLSPAQENPRLPGSKSVPSVNALWDGTRSLRPHVPTAEPSQELGALYASESAQVSR